MSDDVGTRRFRDRGESVYDFMDEMLVECPRCGACAVHRQKEAEARPGWFAPRRLVCVECGLVEEWQEREIARHTRGDLALDDYFGLPLWLRERCRHGEVWAYNARHLRRLEEYVAAELRERAPDPKWGWANQSLTSRLPRWMKDRKNRDDVLRALARLRARVPERFR